mgnify:CR=1 FL=1
MVVNDYASAQEISEAAQVLVDAGELCRVQLSTGDLVDRAEAFKQADGRESWMTRALPGTELVAYAMNNYWHTNFKADQPGHVSFRVTLLPHGAFDAASALCSQSAWGELTVMPSGSCGSLSTQKRCTGPLRTS